MSLLQKCYAIPLLLPASYYILGMQLRLEKGMKPSLDVLTLKYLSLLFTYIKLYQGCVYAYATLFSLNIYPTQGLFLSQLCARLSRLRLSINVYD